MDFISYLVAQCQLTECKHLLEVTFVSKERLVMCATSGGDVYACLFDL